MRKFLKRISALVVLLTALFFQVSAQSNLQKELLGNGGVMNHITQLRPDQQYIFDPSNPSANLGLNENSGLNFLNAEVDVLGEENFRYMQTYAGLPIENSMIIIRVRAGKTVGIVGNLVMEFPQDMAARNQIGVVTSNAIDLAINKVGATRYAWQSAQMEQNYKNQMDNQQATYFPSPSLCWYSFGESIDPSNLRLCYKVDIYAEEPLSRANYYVDATSGKVLGQNAILCHVDAVGTAATAYSGTQTIHSDNNTGTNYRLRDLTKGNGIITLTAAGADYSNTSANWSLTGTNQYALDAHYGVSQTYSFYLSNFNRNSVNNAGYALTSYVNETATTDNAYWDGTSMHFGNRSSNGAGITAIDVDGHELTHGVTQYTCNLTYSSQSGAMNESMSDIFGKSVQFWSKPTDVNWMLSNDMGWNIRNMSNPNAFSQPDTYLGTYWYTGTADNGGVHTNSGVGNFMFYLLVTGGSGTNDIGNAYSVSGIGLTKADAILYRTETVYLVPSSNYTAWRAACVSAATDLYGASSNEVSQVMNAWYAVGIGAAAPSGTCAIPAGLSSSSITDNGAVVSWTANADASSYVLSYKASSATTWTNVATAGTTATLTGLVSGTTYSYQVQAVCISGGNTAFSAASTFTTTGVAPIVYCTSVGQTLDGITNVTFNTINNVTSGTSAGYTDYTATQSTTVTAGNTYILSAKLNTGGNYTNYAKAWIDWNHDGTFSTTTEEYNLGTAVNVTNGQTTLSPSITVPTGAYIGTTRMRVSTQYAAAPSPCTASFDGEVEDYSIVVSAGSSCATPSGLASSAVTGSGATISWASTGAAAYNLQWKLSSATTWTTVSGLTTNSYSLTGLAGCSAYSVQVMGDCGTAQSTYSSPISFSTTGCCNAPTGVAASAITASGANIAWASTGAALYNLQWKLSTATTWNTVTGITTNAYTLSGLSACSTYNVQVMSDCGTAQSAYSTAASFSTTGCAITYCTSKGTNQNREYIKKVVLGTINNTTGSNTGYGDFTALSTNLTGGTANSINLTPGFVTTSRREYWNVWIDYNHNGVFTDAGERVAQVNGTSAVTKSFTVPTTALNGATRMRIQMQYNSYVSTSCTTYTNGEVEDYTVVIVGNAAFAGIQEEPEAKVEAAVIRNEMTLYPNPTSVNLNIQISSASESAAQMTVYNLMGQKVTSFNVNLIQGKNSYMLETAEFDNGIYILEVSGKAIQMRQQFVVTK